MDSIVTKILNFPNLSLKKSLKSLSFCELLAAGILTPNFVIIYLLQGLWLYYLQLFTAQGTADDAKELYEQALVFAPAYLIWWQYIEFQVSYCGRKDVCLRLLDHLVHNPQENVEVHSHHILETLLYVVQLELFTSHYKKALGCLQAALGRLKGTSSNTRIPDLTSHLVPNDHCLLWIAYIHVFEFHRVPLQWYEPSCGKPSRMVSKEHFVFPWQPSKGSRAPYEKLLTLFHGEF